MEQQEFRVPPHIIDAAYYLVGYRNPETIAHELDSRLLKVKGRLYTAFKEANAGIVNRFEIKIDLSCPPLEFFIYRTTDVGNNRYGLNAYNQNMPPEEVLRQISSLQKPLPPIHWAICFSGYPSVFKAQGMEVVTDGIRLGIKRLSVSDNARVAATEIYEAEILSTLDYLTDLRDEYFHMAHDRFLKQMNQAIESGTAWRHVGNLAM